MSVQLESVERINALKNGIEAITGESYDNLTAGVQALKNGYGQGGGTAESKPEQEKTVDVTENGTIEVLPDEGSVLSKVTVNVNVESDSGFPYIDSSKMTSFARFHSGGANSEFINKWNTSNAISLESMFSNCPLSDYVLDLNTSKAENCQSMCNGQYSGSDVRFKNKLDMSNCTNCYSMFYKRKMSEFPLENTGKVATFRLAFQENVFTEAELDLTSCMDIREAFIDCNKMTKLTLRNSQKLTSSYFATALRGCKALVDFYIDSLTVNDNNLDFTTCTSLSVESLVNILNALSDNTSLATTYTVKLGATNLVKLTAEQKQIATNKNIALA